MSVRSFKDLQDEVFRLYNAHAYQEALALIDREAARFAAHGSDLYYWRACLACRAEGAEAGLRWLQEAADRGLWYHERMLQDPDLAPLRDDRRLTPLLAVFRERREAVQANARSVLQTFSPDGEARGLLLALHGNTSGFEDEEERDHWLPAVEAGWKVALAQSSQVCAPGRYFWADRGRALAEISTHLAALEAPETTVLAGFSAGGALVIHGVLGSTLPVNRFLAVAPAIRLESVMPLLEACRHDVRGYVVVGEHDFAYQAARQFAEAMRQAGLPCGLEVHPGLGHDFPAGFGAGLRQRLDRLVNVEKGW